VDETPDRDAQLPRRGHEDPRRHPVQDDPHLAQLHRQMLRYEATSDALHERAQAAGEPAAAALLRRAEHRRRVAVRIATYLGEVTGRPVPRERS
jgi:hypothetical protein